MNPRRMYLYAVMTLLTAAMWTVPAQGQRDKVKPNLDEGARIYKQNCINCHGPGGKGDGVAAGQLDPKLADLTSSNTQDKKNAELFEVVKFGRPGTAMPGWLGQIDEGEIQNVLAYVRLLAQ